MYKGIASIKYLNKSIGDRLLEMSKLKEVSDFGWIKFCQYIIDNKIAQSNQMEILIRLDFFKKFGKKEILLESYQVMTDKKKVNLILFPEFSPQTIQIEKRNRKKEIRYEDKIIKRPLKYDVKHKESTKQERLENLQEFYNLLLERPPKEITLYDQISFEKEYLGYAYSKWENLDSKICLVLDINTKYTPLCTLYQVSTGKEFFVKVKKKNFWLKDEIQMLYTGDVIFIKDLTKEEGWKQVEGKWERNPNKMELHLNKCSLVRKSPLRTDLTE